MIIVYACLVLLLGYLVAPGSQGRRLAETEIRRLWLVWVAFAVQLLVISVLPDLGGLSQAGHLLSYLLAGAFAVANRRLPGAVVVAAGGASNLAAITANGGTMPASPSALAASGWSASPDHFANSAALPDARLAWLGDVFATPGWLPVHSVFSVGDVLIVVGFGVFLHLTLRRPGRSLDDEAPSEETAGTHAV